ncbi:FxsA family protein [Rhodovulum steppense]|uniref:UPF0716 protein FxsA n=1 Tax=Rhodovulum steppense TaxID=540251 RepID=A0A4R1YPV1_9RHOB|nr:FxsA family protein [Rhodovulum steppense]TCM79985.1 UPF0716 protein FxsA [Rhodovulum steppense]
MWIFVLFLCVPLIEIALFIQVGGAIGLWATLAIVVLTAVIGTLLIRQQGAMAMAQLRNSFRELRDPAEPLAHGAMILFAGALLLTPGFFTDAVGFALLMPPVRAAAYRWLSQRIVVQSMTYGADPGPRPRAQTHGDVIEGEFEELRSGDDQPRGRSGWTQH